MKIELTWRNRAGRIFIILLVLVVGIGIFAYPNLKGFVTSEDKVDQNIENLLGLPYLAYVEDDPNPDKSGVTLYNPDLTFKGVNLYISRYNRGAYLKNMAGDLIHEWLPTEELSDRWVFSEMDEEGNLIVLINFLGLIKLDWDSNILWISNDSENPYMDLKGQYPFFQEEFNTRGYHHDFEVAENGDIYVLAGHERIIEHEGVEIPILENSIVILDSQGNPKGVISLYDLIGDFIPVESLDTIADNVLGVENKLSFMIYKLRSLIYKSKKLLIKNYGVDVFHANTIEVIPIDIDVANKGDLLFCARNLDLVGIIDIETKKLKWSWGPGILDRPHNPTVLENGNILIFDNGWHREYSRVIELNPTTKEISWKFEADPPESFFSTTRGASQRLPNGNTLITESNKGYVFEVTKDGEIVWEFWNPDFDEQGRRTTIYRMTRYNQSFQSMESMTSDY
jgi:hypothetical protein